MKAHELLNAPQAWCQDSPAKDARGHKRYASDPRAVSWCALAAIHKAYAASQREQAMERVLRALDVSERGLARMSATDKACCIMEWNDDRQSSFPEVRAILRQAPV